MLSLAEYNAYANDIITLGQQTDQQIAERTQDSPNTQAAVKQTKKLMSTYQGQLNSILQEAMMDIGINALHHYASQAQMEVSEEIVKKVVKDQYTKRYYGATLAQRLVLMKLRLNRVITQTAAVGQDHLPGLFSASFPFGAQSNVSKRLLQGTAIKVEQDIGKRIAKEADYPLMRWTLSPAHAHQCACEDLASATNNKVKEYLTENNIDIDSTGLYFVDDLPDPPHPNCQCEWNLVGHDELIPSREQRPRGRLLNLIRKLLRS